jgi:AraC-like DNA-binding protein
MSPTAARTEWSHYYHYPDLQDLEVLHAGFSRHRFSRHMHEYFVIGYVESGVQTYLCRGSRHHTSPGQIFIVNPGDLHTGESASPEGYVYRTVYPRTALMRNVVAELSGREREPFFRQAVVHDETLARLLLRFHRAVRDDPTRLAIESLLSKALARMILLHADLRVSLSRMGNERRATRRVREFIEAHFATDITLAQLSDVTGLSTFYLARVFEKDMGIAPHAYLDAVRIRNAREMLERGVPLAEVSVAVGYSDQSHFTHRFKRASGITPGQYVRERKILQD